MRVSHLFLAFGLFVSACFAQSTSQNPSAPPQKPPADTANDERPKTIADSINVTWSDEARDFIDLADAIPEDKWNFKPADGAFQNVRTVAEQVKHVACANEGFAKEMRGEAPPEACDKGGPNPAKTKAELVDYLKASFQMLDDQINQIDASNQMKAVDGPYGGPNTRIGMALLAVWHVADHYGQLVEYARMNNIVPPASRPQPSPTK